MSVAIRSFATFPALAQYTPGKRLLEYFFPSLSALNFPYHAATIALLQKNIRLIPSYVQRPFPA